LLSAIGGDGKQSALNNPTDCNGTVSCEKELIALCNAVHTRVRSDITSARKSALIALGSERKLADSCGVIAFFNFVDRLADASGVRVEANRINSGMKIADSNVLHSSTSPLTQGLLNPRIITVAGFVTCPFHRKALAAAKTLVQRGLASEVVDKTFSTRDEYRTWLFSEQGRDSFRKGLNNRKALEHTSSPLVWTDENTYVGGCDDLIALANLLSSFAPTASTSRL